MSSMVIEFTRKEDLKQACYEATLDLNLYIAHILDIAGRCQAHFPEVAAGLLGSVDGLRQYLRGIDGEWKTVMTENLHAILSGDEFRNHQWAYEFCRDPRVGVMLFGCMAGVAASKPNLTFWEVLEESRRKIADFEPMIEQLLKSSPKRNPVQ